MRGSLPFGYGTRSLPVRHELVEGLVHEVTRPQAILPPEGMRPMTEPSTDLTRTPLEAEHLSLGAHMGAFAGWLMPITYRGTLAEHQAVRESVGVFDVSHLGRVMVEGAGAMESLHRTLTNDLAKVGPGEAQ